MFYHSTETIFPYPSTLSITIHHVILVYFALIVTVCVLLAMLGFYDLICTGHWILHFIILKEIHNDFLIV